MTRRSFALTWMSAALMVACAQGGPAKEQRSTADDQKHQRRYATILEAPPRTPITQLGPVGYEPTVESHRFLFVNQVEQRHLPLLRRIKAEQIGNFGGIDWRWHDGPENGGLGQLTGVVYFLRAPAATLARYTRDPLFRPAAGGFSREEQNQVAEGWAERIGRDVALAGYGNMTVPQLHILLSRAEFEKRRKAQGWRLPVNLALRFDPAAEPDLPAVAAEVAPLLRAYPQESRVGGPTPDIATFDAVVLRDGCLFIDGEGADDPLVEMPFGVGLFRDSEGHLSLRGRYSQHPQVLGRVGTRLQLGWRTPPRPAPAALKKACKARTIVTVSSADQAAGYGPDWFAVRQYADRLRLSPAEAMARANACLLRTEQRLADARLGRPERIPADDCPAELRSVPPPPPPSPSQASGA